MNTEQTSLLPNKLTQSQTQLKEMSDSTKQLSVWHKRLMFARKIGRGICILLILVICVHTIYNVLRLLDSFQEKDVASVRKKIETDEPLDIPMISFDSQGQWHIQGLHFDPAQTPFQAIMPMPETAGLIGTRTDKDGVPLMQLYDITEEDINERVLQTSIETRLLENWTTQGWNTKRIEIPNLVSYRCDHGEKQCFVQFFSDKVKIYVLISLSTTNFK